MFTYLIGWSKEQIWYYGVSWAKGRTAEDLWKTYFTSSKHVTRIRIEKGEPDVVQIRKKFNDATAARKWEHKVLRRMKVVESQRWINKTDNIAIDPDCARRGAMSNKGEPKSFEHKKKLSEAIKKYIEENGHPRKGKRHSEETKRKLRECRAGRTLSQETKRKISQARRNPRTKNTAQESQ